MKTSEMTNQELKDNIFEMQKELNKRNELAWIKDEVNRMYNTIPKGCYELQCWNDSEKFFTIEFSKK